MGFLQLLFPVFQSDSPPCILNAYLEGKEQESDLNQREKDLQSKGRHCPEKLPA